MTPIDTTFFDDKASVASEYVLGLLTDAERTACRQQMVHDRSFRLEVEKFEAHFAPLTDEFESVKPPRRLISKIDKQLFASNKSSFWSSLNLWRGLTTAAAGLAVAAIILPGLIKDLEIGPKLNRQLIASLEAEGSDVKYLALYETADGTLKIRSISGSTETGKSQELWLIEGSKAPLSLGVIDDGHVSIPIAQFVERQDTSLTFAISLEELGGSKDGTPHGPIIAAGQALEL